jgi:hypothetical protein
MGLLYRVAICNHKSKADKGILFKTILFTSCSSNSSVMSCDGVPWGGLLGVIVCDVI